MQKKLIFLDNQGRIWVRSSGMNSLRWTLKRFIAVFVMFWQLLNETLSQILVFILLRKAEMKLLQGNERLEDLFQVVQSNVRDLITTIWFIIQEFGFNLITRESRERDFSRSSVPGNLLSIHLTRRLLYYYSYRIVQ